MISAAFIGVGVALLLLVVVLAAVALTDADAPAPGPAPVRDASLLPFGLDDGLDEYREAWDAAVERHVQEAQDINQQERDDFDLWAAELTGDRRRR